MESPGAAGRRRGTSRSNVEDQALDQIAKEVSTVIPFNRNPSKPKHTHTQTDSDIYEANENQMNIHRSSGHAGHPTRHTAYIRQSSIAY